MLVQDIQIKDLERREAAAYKRADALEARLRDVEMELAGERGRRHGESRVARSWKDDLTPQDVFVFCVFFGFMIVLGVVFTVLAHGH